MLRYKADAKRVVLSSFMRASIFHVLRRYIASNVQLMKKVQATFSRNFQIRQAKLQLLIVKWEHSL